MKVVWSETFPRVYASGPAAAAGRLDGIVEALQGWAEWAEPSPASEEALFRCHEAAHLEWVRREGVGPRPKRVLAPREAPPSMRR